MPFQVERHCEGLGRGAAEVGGSKRMFGGGAWTSWGGVSVTGSWVFLLPPPSPSLPPRRRKGRGRSNRSDVPEGREETVRKTTVQEQHASISLAVCYDFRACFCLLAGP